MLLLGGIEAGSIFLDKHWELQLERAALQLEIHELAVFLENSGFFPSLTLLVICLVPFSSSLTKIWLFLSCVAQPLLPPTPHKKVFHPKPFPPLAGVGNTFPQYLLNRYWNVHSVCIMQCSEELTAEVINQLCDLSSPEHSLCLAWWTLPETCTPALLDQGSLSLGAFLGQSSAHGHGRSAGNEAGEQLPAPLALKPLGGLGTHLFLHQKCLLEIIVLILFIYLCCFFASLPCWKDFCRCEIRCYCLIWWGWSAKGSVVLNYSAQTPGSLFLSLLAAKIFNFSLPAYEYYKFAFLKLCCNCDWQHFREMSEICHFIFAWTEIKCNQGKQM